MQDERNQALDRVNLLDMELTAVRSAVNDVQGALHKEQQRSMELADAVAAKDKVRGGSG
jgi:chromosome condensin MukBEF ATPase and DNA-binding subunit MukB